MKHKNKIVTHMLTLTLNLILALKSGGEGGEGPILIKIIQFFFKFSQFDPILVHIVNVRILKYQPIHTPNFT